MEKSIEKSYEIAKEKYADYGVDTDNVIEKIERYPFCCTWLAG